MDIWCQSKPGPRFSPERSVARQLLAAVGDAPIAAIPTLEVYALVSGWKARHTKSTTLQKTGLLRQLLRVISASTGTPIPQLPKLPKAPRRGRIATEPELQALWSHAPVALKFLLVAWGELGLRYAEAVRISSQDLNLERHEVRVLVKGGATRTYPATPRLEQLAQAAYPIPDGQQSTPLFFLLGERRYKTWPSPYNTARRAWERCRKAAGVPHDLRIHDLRRTLATNLYRQTLDITAVQQVLGHSDLSTTTCYLKPQEPEKMRQLLSQLHWKWNKGEKQP